MIDFKMLKNNRILFLLFCFLLFTACAETEEEIKTTEKIVFQDYSQESWQKVSEERADYPFIINVEKWVQISAPISETQNFAPGIFEGDDKYRIVWNDYINSMLTSAVSEDGIVFEKDNDFEYKGFQEKDNCIPSHPWFAKIGGKYRMYYNYFTNPKNPEKKCPYEFIIYSAESTDGKNFENEIIVVQPSEENNLVEAGHGRITQIDADTYRMFFSAGYKNVTGPASVLGATSSDGITWTLDEKPVLHGTHDPALFIEGEQYHMYAAYLMYGMIHLVSDDGYTFNPIAWVEFYDTQGKPFIEFGDVELLVNKDNRVLLYGGGKVDGEKEGIPGQIILERNEK